MRKKETNFVYLIDWGATGHEARKKEFFFFFFLIGLPCRKSCTTSSHIVGKNKFSFFIIIFLNRWGTRASPTTNMAEPLPNAIPTSSLYIAIRLSYNSMMW
jgi:hypothetical protein